MSKKYWLHCGTYIHPTCYGSQLIEYGEDLDSLEQYLAPILGDNTHPARPVFHAKFPDIDWSLEYTPFSRSRTGNLFQVSECSEESLSHNESIYDLL